MTEKIFKQSEIYEITNKLLLAYLRLFDAEKMSFAEYTLVENIISKIQIALDEFESDEND